MGPEAQRVSDQDNQNIANVWRRCRAAEANEAHPATTVVKSQEAAESLRTVVGMDIRFMVGCDQA